MPKTPIDKHRNSRFLERKVGSSRQLKVPPPALDSVLTKQSRQSQFRRSVTAPANARHDFGTLCLGEHIAHASV